MPRLILAFALLVLSACDAPPARNIATPARVPASMIDARMHAQAVSTAEIGVPASAPAKQILFGDLHVHTTISADAFVFSLPILQGEGAHPPADACDYARFCSGLDFWSINDHAESISPANWQRTKESVRQCNAVAGDPDNPDLVTFLGWEWTQAGATAEEHFGHKNVIFRDTAEDVVPARPISALTPQMLAALQTGISVWQRLSFLIYDWSNRSTYFDMAAYQKELQNTPVCAPGIDVRELPGDCLESAESPDVLFEKLNQWGYESIVIPHGTTWGIYAPPGSSWEKQLAGDNHDPKRQTLFEVYSGHGNAEEYRAWRPVESDGAGGLRCPEPSPGYEPCCWRAGEIIRARCEDASPEECERRVQKARQDYVDAGITGHRTVPGAQVEDWLDCGQCRDCFNPAFQYRPAASAQYALAISNFDDPEESRRFRFGFIASSDNHRARPGTGFKETDRYGMTETAGPCSEDWRERLMLRDESPAPESRAFAIEDGMLPLQYWETERQASFFMTGGLVATHATGRDRDSIWEALKRREVYGTSGDRILLWFDLLNGPNGVTPMGSDLAIGESPRFRVNAVGAFVQLPGCPESSLTALSADRLDRLCRGECDHPSDVRKRIERIEVVRIRPQIRPDESVAELIDDPWFVHRCEPDEAGCTVEFEDPEFLAGRRDAIYYARVLQEPTLAVNAGGLRCTYDADGSCTAVDPCWGDYRRDRDDDCLSTNRERAWSSPIFLAPTRPLN